MQPKSWAEVPGHDARCDADEKLGIHRPLGEPIGNPAMDLAETQAILDLATASVHGVAEVTEALQLPQIIRERDQLREKCERLWAKQSETFEQVSKFRFIIADLMGWSDGQPVPDDASLIQYVRDLGQAAVRREWDLARERVLMEVETERDQAQQLAEQLRAQLAVVNKMAQQANQDLLDEQQDHENLVGAVNDVILRMSRTAAPQELGQMLREAVNASTPSEDVIRHKHNARRFVEAVANVLGAMIPEHMTPDEVIAEARRQHGVVLDFMGVLDELDSIVANWKGDWLSTTGVIQRLSALVANGGEGSALTSELEAWQLAHFRLRTEVLRVADKITVDYGYAMHSAADEIRTACAKDEPLRRDYAQQHRDDIVPDSGEAIEPWRPHHAPRDL